MNDVVTCDQKQLNIFLERINEVFECGGCVVSRTIYLCLGFWHLIDLLMGDVLLNFQVCLNGKCGFYAYLGIVNFLIQIRMHPIWSVYSVGWFILNFLSIFQGVPSSKNSKNNWNNSSNFQGSKSHSKILLPTSI
jgi:hypothetical protein